MGRELRFPGFALEDFDCFAILDRRRRRAEILSRFHPRLAALGEDLLAAFRARGITGLYPHLPQLNWPRNYEPFCTWLALSNQPHRYQRLAQLNVGVHRPYVAVRLGFDTAADEFGRFLFLLTHGDLGEILERVAVPAGLRCRVYKKAPWPEGSRAIFDSGEDFLAGVRVAERDGANWFEVGKVLGVEDAAKELSSPGFAGTCAEILLALYPLYRRLAGPGGTVSESSPSPPTTPTLPGIRS
jgi:hypothetical protein